MTAEPVPRNVPSRVASRRGRLAGLTARGADPARIAAARRELVATNLSTDLHAWVERAAAACPPLTPAEIAATAALADRIDRRLAAILRPAQGGTG